MLWHFGNESYSEPHEVYELARQRGMDLVALTDHDSIEGALLLARLPGTFVSEEVTCELPGRRKLHLGVFEWWRASSCSKTSSRPSWETSGTSATSWSRR